MCQKKDIVDIIINVLQILALRQGQTKIENKISKLGKRTKPDSEKTGTSEEDDSEDDKVEIKRLKQMLKETIEDQ